MSRRRREVLGSTAHACPGAITFAAIDTSSVTPRDSQQQSPRCFLLVGLCGSENPARGNFPFVWAAALKEAGHDVRIELAGDGTVVMRTVVANSVTAVGWPPFSLALARVIEHGIPSSPEAPVQWSTVS